MTYSIDYTTLADPDTSRRGNPWDALNSCKPFRELPAGRLQEYVGTRYDLFTVYLPRKGISLQEPVKAFAYGHVKIMECAGKYYLNVMDGLVYEKPIFFGPAMLQGSGLRRRKSRVKPDKRVT